MSVGGLKFRSLAAEVRGALEQSLEAELNHHGGVHGHQHGGVDIADAFNTGEPRLSAGTDGVEGAPHAVGEVEPDSAEPHEVKHGIDGIGKRVLDPVIAVGGVELIAHVRQFDKHHFGPEIVEVQAESEGDNDAQDEHVLRSPFHFFGTIHHGIAIVTACATVLEGEDEGIDEVQQHQSAESGRSRHRVPVGAQHLTNPVVAAFRKEGHDIHATVEREEENERQSGDRHDHFSSDR